MKKSQLAWHCRRGMRELDVLLSDWLERRYEQAGAAQKAAFRRLLALPDPELAGYLLGGKPPPDAEIARVIAELRRTPSP